MKRLTEEQKQLIIKSLEQATTKQAFIVGWWSLINSKKLHELYNKLSIGMSFVFAYKEAKEHIKFNKAVKKFNKKYGIKKQHDEKPKNRN